MFVAAKDVDIPPKGPGCAYPTTIRAVPYSALWWDVRTKASTEESVESTVRKWSGIAARKDARIMLLWEVSVRGMGGRSRSRSAITRDVPN